MKANRKGATNKRIATALLLACSILGSLVGLEWALRAWLPAQIVTIGSSFPENARLYGWGYGPHERIVVSDPDTGKRFVDFANNRGWRDLDRAFEKPAGRFRVLVLGDSNTFGAIVPAEAVYTRVLERKLLAEGFDAEVINMSYGGWSTDQELEALRIEGLRYRPDLVILQFTNNDLGENFYEPVPGVRQSIDKPFYYQIDGGGNLMRNANKHFTSMYAKNWKENIKKILTQFEIAKWAYSVYLNLMLENRHYISSGYRVEDRQLWQLEMAFGVTAADPLGAFLHGTKGRPIDETELKAKIGEAGLGASEEAILRIARDAWFKHYWNRETYHPMGPRPDSIEWRLFAALLRAIQSEVDSIGARLALLSCHEQGLYDWERYWFRISPESEDRNNFFAINQLLAASAERAGIEVVDPAGPFRRATFDPHPDVRGNEVMAESLHRYIMTRYRPALEDRRDAARRGS